MFLTTQTLYPLQTGWTGSTEEEWDVLKDEVAELEPSISRFFPQKDLYMVLCTGLERKRQGLFWCGVCGTSLDN
jgi:hypothetical protein